MQKISIKRIVVENWALFVPLFYILTVFVYIYLHGEDIYIQSHDLLDDKLPVYKMLYDGKLWFSSKPMPYLHSEYQYFVHCASFLKFQSLFYILFPTFWAFVLLEIFKVLLAVFGGLCLGKICYKNKFSSYNKGIVILISFVYGILPLQPMEVMGFASLPCLLALFIVLYQSNSFKLLPIVVLYPLFSTFSFFGLFICGYILLFFIVDTVIHRKLKWIMLAALVCIIIGYVITEYKLFYQMLFADEPSLRSVSYVMTTYGLKEMFKNCFSVFRNNQYHAGSLQAYVVLPVCLVYFVYSNFLYIKNGEKKKIIFDKFNWLAVWFLFNIILYGLDHFRPFLKFVALLCPPLNGLSFARGVWFNPFIIYTMFCVALCNFEKLTHISPKRIALCAAAILFVSAKSNHLKVFEYIIVFYIIAINIPFFKVDVKKSIPYLLAFFAILIVPFNAEHYNHIHLNLKNQRLILNRRIEETSLTYREFFSEKLFEKIKKEIGYDGEWSVAYGMHPSILYYNGIHTLDGYHSYYSEAYKQKFRKIIAPELDINDYTRKYFDDWGGRAYVFSSDFDYEPVRKMPVDSAPMYINPDAFANLEGKYVFSRGEISNYQDLGFHFVGKYSDATSPYVIWVYKN